MRWSRIRTLVYIGTGLMLVLTGCAQQPTLPAVSNPQEAWAARQVRLGQLSRWDLSGRISVSNGKNAWQGSLSWRQAPKTYTIEVDGPFGQSQFQLRGNAAGVVLRTADNKQYWANDPERLLFEETGLRMPVSGLRYWVLGLVAKGAGIPTARDRELDTRGRLVRFTQGGWRVRIRSYTQVGDFELPEKIFLRRENIDLRLVVDRWRLYTDRGLQTRRAGLGARAPAGV